MRGERRTSGTLSLLRPPLRISWASFNRDSASALAVCAARSWVLSSLSCWAVTRPAAAAGALVEVVASAVVLDRLVRLAHLLAQFGHAAEQELVDAVHRLDLVATLIVEISLGEGVGDGGGCRRVLRLGLDAEHVRATEGRDVDAGQQDVDHPVVAYCRQPWRRDFGAACGLADASRSNQARAPPACTAREVQARPERRLAQAQD